jgi:hypothetical protein
MENKKVIQSQSEGIKEEAKEVSGIRWFFSCFVSFA